jgi:hypothetical protein
MALQIMEACTEQSGIAYDGTNGNESGTSQAVQMLRALRHKNVAAVKTKSFLHGPRQGFPSIDICCSSPPPFREAFEEEEEEEVRG